MTDWLTIFRANLEHGRLYWLSPPANHAELVGKEAGYLTVGKGKNKSYWMVRTGGRTYKRGRVIFYIANGRWPTPALDHINGDSCDDSLANLRECTLSQNAVNSRDKERTVALPRGVYPTRQGRFMARLTVGRKSRSLGTFDTPEQAAIVYRRGRKEAFGEYA